MPDDTPNITTPENTNSADTGVLGGAAATPPAPESILGTKPGDAPAATPEVTPEVKYEFKDAPEGFDTKELEAFAKENKITPEAAQKLLERDVGQQKSFVDTMQAKFKELSTVDWVKQLKADPVMGGKNWDATLTQVRRANDMLSPELRKQINDEGLQNSPILVRAMYEIGAKLKEDSFVRDSNSGSPAKKSYTDIMYH